MARTSCAAGALALLAAAAAAPAATVPRLDHVVVVMMENLSFDHLLGWLPGANGRQAGLSYVDRSGVRRSTYPLAPDFQGCGHPGPDHSYDGARVEFAGGACDGFLQAPQMNAPEAYIQLKPGLIEDDGTVTNEATEALLRRFMVSFFEYIERVLTVVPAPR